MIVIDRLTKTFPERMSLLAWARQRFVAGRRLVLDDVSLTIARGELVGLLGGNGAGKTALLHVLATLSRADRGVVTVGGAQVDVNPSAVRRSIGFCGSAERGFYYRLTVVENLRFFGAVSRQLAAADVERRIDEVLALVDLREQRDRLYAHLSTGMRQRLAIARALLGDPPVLLFDEPTRAVDPIHADAIRMLIRTTLVEQLGKTVVLATNLLDEAWAICHRVAVLRGGRVIALDTPAGLDQLREPLARYRIIVGVASDDLVARVREIPGFRDLNVAADGAAVALEVAFVPLEASLGALLRAVTRDGADVRSIEARHASPGDVFAELIGA